MNEGANDRRPAVVVFVAVVIMVVVLSGFWWSWGGGVAPGDASARVRDQRGDHSVVAATGSIDREAQGIGGAAGSGVGDESAFLEWKLRVLVIDEHGEPVHEVRVTAGSGIGYDAMWARVQPDGGYESVAQTDADGRATLDVLGPFAFVRWEKDVEVFRHGMIVDRAAEGGAELVLAMFGPLPVRGMVRNGDGTPAAGAVVEVAAVDGSKVDPVTSRADGSFEVALLIGKRYQVRAGKGDAWTPFAKVWPTGVDDSIELKFARANPITISGDVFTSVGEPAVDATVFAFSLETGARRSVFTVHGKFEMKLSDYGAYSLMAIAPGSGASKVVRAAATASAPRTRVTLRMTEIQYLRGRVVDAAGKPRGGATVSAEQVAKPEGLIAAHRLEVTQPETVRTERDGTFELRVSPDTNWKLKAYSFSVGSRLDGKVDLVASGAENIEILVRPMAERPLVELSTDAAERRETCPFRLHVTTRGDGDLPRCRVDVSRSTFFVSGGGQLVSPVAGKPTALKPLPADQEVWVHVRPEDPELATVSRGPIKTARDTIDLDIELQPWAQVPVLVVDASGKPVPACGVFVRSSSTAPSMGGRFTDPSGRATLFRVPPGRMQLVVRRPGSSPVEQFVEFLPGRNAGMVVRLR